MNIKMVQQKKRDIEIILCIIIYHTLLVDNMRDMTCVCQGLQWASDKTVYSTSLYINTDPDMFMQVNSSTSLE